MRPGVFARALTSTNGSRRASRFLEILPRDFTVDRDFDPIRIRAERDHWLRIPLANDDNLWAIYGRAQRSRRLRRARIPGHLERSLLLRHWLLRLPKRLASRFV